MGLSIPGCSVAVAVKVTVLVVVGEAEGVAVSEGDGVAVVEAVGVAVGMDVFVGIGVCEGVSVGTGVKVRVNVAVGVALGTMVAVDVTVATGCITVITAPGNGSPLKPTFPLALVPLNAPAFRFAWYVPSGAPKDKLYTTSRFTSLNPPTAWLSTRMASPSLVL
jgi:hypothetical protein